MTDYTPIDCDLYSRFELVILHRHTVRVSWREGQQAHVETLLPMDLATRQHEEFLIAEAPDGRRLEIRLDRILKMDPV
jgi:Rho-binding antiterminator